MRYHIDTIALWDVLKAGDECPLCLLRRKTEHQMADRYLGASVMEPDTRIRVNEKGFCPSHQRMLFDRQNRLGHALMMLSHLQELRKRLPDALSQTAPTPSPGLLARLSGRNRREAPPENGVLALAQGCVMCDHLHMTMDQYGHALLHLWKTDQRFRDLFAHSKGLCLVDTGTLLALSGEVLSGQQKEEFCRQAAKLLQENLERLEEELNWFTRKFDYRNAEAPWGNSRDALERTANKLRGWCIGKDPGLNET